MRSGATKAAQGDATRLTWFDGTGTSNSDTGMAFKQVIWGHVIGVSRLGGGFTAPCSLWIGMCHSSGMIRVSPQPSAGAAKSVTMVLAREDEAGPCLVGQAKFRVTLTAARGLTALSNAPKAAVTDAAGGRLHHSFEETPPMSTYLLAIVVRCISLSAGQRVWCLALGAVSSCVVGTGQPLQSAIMPERRTAVRVLHDTYPRDWLSGC